MAPLHILTLDGGGMRGLYSATVLQTLATRFAEARGTSALDVGKGFDLVLGTSTGAILAAAVAAGIPLGQVIALYEEAGPRIFQDPIPFYHKAFRLCHRVRFWHWVVRHLCRPGNTNDTLDSETRGIFGDLTFGELYRERRVGVCISSTAFLGHTPRVFKTPHLEKKDRDNRLTLADACLASTAAPIYFPLASIKEDGLSGQIHVDGGLWANNPVLLGVIEGLTLSAPEEPIVVVSVGTNPPRAGSPHSVELNRGIGGWRGGILPLELAMNAQGQAAHHAANIIAGQLTDLGKPVDIIRCKETSPSVDQTPFLQLDSASPKALALMRQLGSNDGHQTYRWTQNGNRHGELLTQIFKRMPEIDDSTRTVKEGQDEKL